METGLYLFFIAVTGYYYLSRIKTFAEVREPKKLILLGILLSLTDLSRLDGILFLAAILMHISYMIIRKHHGPTWVNRLQFLFRTVALMIAAPLIVLMAWFIFNYKNTGSLLPISGQAIRLISINYCFGAGTFRDQFPIQDIPLRYYYENFSYSLMKLLWHHPFTHSLSMFYSDLFHLSVMETFQNFALASLLVLTAFVITLTPFAFRSLRLFSSPMMFYFFYAFSLLCAFSFYIFGQWFYYRYYFPIYFLLTICGGQIFFSIYVNLKKIHKNLGTVFKGILFIFYLLSISLQIKKRLYCFSTL